MKICFEITDIPKGWQKKYPAAYLEGVLWIFVDNAVFFSQPGILLIEFALFVKQWLSSVGNGKVVDFIYESMDNEDPILSISYVGDGCYKIYSIWQETEALKVLSKENIVAEFEKYLDDLDDELKSKMGIELGSVMQDGQL